TQQQAREERLNSLPREELAAALEATRAALDRSREAQAPHQGVRGALAAVGLPAEAASLAPRLAADWADLRRDQQEAVGLPAARDQEQRQAAARAERARELAEAWSAALPDEPPPGAPADAISCLPE